MSSRGVHYDDLVLFLFEDLDAFVCNLDRVGLIGVSVEWASDLGSVLLELVEGACSEGVAADKGGSPASFDVVVGVFCASGGLTGSLETHEHDYLGLASFELVRLFFGV